MGMDFDVQSMVPRFILNDKNGHALACAIQAGVDYLNEHAEAAAALLTDTDHMPEWLADDILWSYGIDFADGLPIERKRDLAQHAYAIARDEGTYNGMTMLTNACMEGAIAGEDVLAIGGAAYGYPQAMVLVTDDGVTAEAVDALQEKTAGRQPLLTEVKFYQGQSIGIHAVAEGLYAGKPMRGYAQVTR